MLHPRRVPPFLLSSLNPNKSPLRRAAPALCLRYGSRWSPVSHPPRRKLPPETVEAPPDSKDHIPGWPEFKANLVQKCKNPDEVRLLDELSPDEALMLMNPGIDMTKREADSLRYTTRTMPSNRNYFTGQPVLEQRVQDVEAIYEKYKHLPQAPSHLWAVRQWTTAGIEQDLNLEAGTYNPGAIKHKHRLRIMTVAKELNKIHPVLMPPELKEWLNRFAPERRAGQMGLRQKRYLDKYRRSKGNGKRKTARAKAQVVPGEGKVYVNGKLAADFFGRVKDVENVIWPLQVLNSVSKYNVWVSTFGGGTTGIFVIVESY
jgi:hypothetical protein